MKVVDGYVMQTYGTSVRFRHVWAYHKYTGILNAGPAT